jgi:serine O-acetyltransferase
MDRCWSADLHRCGGRPAALLREQSLWAIWVYRFGRRVDARMPGLKRRLLTKLYWLLFRAVETVTGISLPKEAQVGPGLRIWHFGGVFINPASVIGAGCTLRQGVTLGNRVPDGPCPVLEDGVELGAYAQVLGGIRLGAGCKVGAMAVVLTDVPAGATAVGNPARIIRGSAVEAAPASEQERSQAA